jgi:hypothetical protein
MIIMSNEIRPDYAHGEEGVVFVTLPEGIKFELTIAAAAKLAANLLDAAFDARKEKTKA